MRLNATVSRITLGVATCFTATNANVDTSDANSKADAILYTITNTVADRHICFARNTCSNQREQGHDRIV
jgi:hypothetical protein